MNAMEIDQNAPVITRDEEPIDAPLAVVWAVFTDVSRWTAWNKDIENAQLTGPFTVSAAIHWSTAGLDIVSTVGELIPQQRIVWSGTSQGILGIHHWQFTPTETGTLVQTDESWSGEPVEKQVELMQAGLDKSLRAWLESLKREAEKPVQPRPERQPA